MAVSSSLIADRVVLLCGLSCVGKTIGAQLLAENFGFHHVEASASIREAWRASGSPMDLDSYAEKSLAEDPTRVPVDILERIHIQGISSLVVSGLRAPGEVEMFRLSCRDVSLVVVQADVEIRLLRCLSRGRAGHPRTARDLVELDFLHERMGVASVASLPEAVTVANNGTIDEYLRRLRSIVGYK